MKKFDSIVVFSLCYLSCFCQEQVRQTELRDFTLQSSAVVTEDGATISTNRYQSKNYWFPVKVPCTVLTGLVANKVYPDH